MTISHRFTLDEMWEHIEKLAAQHSIKVDTRVDRPKNAFAVAEARCICITPLRSAIGYATALHEFGHVILGHLIISGPVDPNLNIERERAAWDWAKGNAIVWTSAMERCRIQSLEALAEQSRRQPS